MIETLEWIIIFFPISLTAGACQGSILDPILYKVLRSDIPNHPSIVLTVYADDMRVTVNN